MKIVRAKESPAENRFVRTVLVDHLNEPMELAVTNNSIVYFIERTGAIKMFDPQTRQTLIVDSLSVNPGEGNGLLGVTLDPDFDRNHFIYFFYTPKQAPVRHQVSRFVLKGKELDKISEKVLLQIPIEYEPSYHTGGSLCFDSNKNLFISVGDNTDPSQSDGYAPIDEREGRLIFDAQRTSANTHDLRGKILRITPLADGTYTIPEGNLFPKDGSQGKPEIYAMGCRNPYRITVDTATNIVYWGEVGPDAGVDGLQGPKGYDEINQARQAGNFGWPYFVADNKPYLDYDFATRSLGHTFNTERPKNNSVNNTGKTDLPPVQKPLLWYPYDQSPEFPELKVGGRSAMAGSVYYFNNELYSNVKFPEYFDQSLFVFDWMRNWIMVLKLDENQNLKLIEPFMPNTKIDKPIDMQFGPQGDLYLIEYGENYGMNNADASLVHIGFNAGNRAPKAMATASDSLGQPPFTVNFSGKQSHDADEDDELTYQWQINGNSFSTQTEAAYTFKEPGIFKATLFVTDKKEQYDSASIIIKVGNSPPDVQLTASKNTTFYWHEKDYDYKVSVSDKEDKTIDTDRIKVSFRYEETATQQLQQGHQSVSTPLAMMKKSDCFACHAVDKRTVGPSFNEISDRYRKTRPVVKLVSKVIHGGGGVWGAHAMSAHPQLSQEEATQMVTYILDITNKNSEADTWLPTEGSVVLDKPHNTNKRGLYVLTASYTDNGGAVVGPLTTVKQISLRPSLMEAEWFDEAHQMKQLPHASGIGFTMGEAKNGSYLLFKSIDLKDVNSISCLVSSLGTNGSISIHLGSPTGKEICRMAYNGNDIWGQAKELTSPIAETQGIHDLYVVVHQQNSGEESLILDWLRFKKK